MSLPQPPVALPDSSPSSTVRPLAKGTLGRQLVLRVAALVAVVAVGLSTVVALAAYTIQISQVDSRLTQALSRETGGGGGGGGRPGGPQPGGQVIGTISCEQAGSTIQGSILTDRSYSEYGVRYTALSTPALQQLGALELKPGTKTTVRLSDYGLYRVASLGTEDARIIVGIPMGELASAMTTLVIVEALLTCVVIGLAVLVTQRVVVRSLAPLNRLAATATTVSNLPLDSGEVERIVRVPSTDTDPVSEAGRVGLAFNHMIDNVEGALASRHSSEVKLRQFVADASH